MKVDLYLEPIPNIFKFMKRSEEILSEWPDDRKYDLFIAQDCGDAKRLGNAAKYFESAEHTICVDHHVSNQNFAEHNYIFPDASSTCELILNCFQTSALTGRSQNVSTPEWCMIPVFSSIPALPEKRWRSQESLSKKELTSQR